ncbi:MAG: hypothetical protein EZS28_015979 [Streblomastix strix]|uniref:Uncharacterized protein n=1 Tax=Streblomastix strix TaxID=222440 RepID=A0A5J4W0X1_9EUKA|nr:MAG: hypothetical protein EZS28_015979 [Streblomastix strix]
MLPVMGPKMKKNAFGDLKSASSSLIYNINDEIRSSVPLRSEWNNGSRESQPGFFAGSFSGYPSFGKQTMTLSKTEDAFSDYIWADKSPEIQQGTEQFSKEKFNSYPDDTVSGHAFDKTVPLGTFKGNTSYSFSTCREHEKERPYDVGIQKDFATDPAG